MLRGVHFQEQMRKTAKQLQMMPQVLLRESGDTQPTRPFSCVVMLKALVFCVWEIVTQVMRTTDTIGRSLDMAS